MSYSQTWLWAQSGNGSGSGTDEGNSVCTDLNGNVFVTGGFNSPIITFGSTTFTSAGGYDAFIVKYDSNGNMLWAKSAGGNQMDGGNSVSTDAVGNIFVTGFFSSPTITFGSTILTNVVGQDIFIVKYDPNGNVLWAKSVGGGSNDAGNSVSSDANGNVYITGNFYSSTLAFGATTLTNAGNSDIFIAKYDSNGNVLWAKSAGGTNDDEGFSVSADANGNVFVTGYFTSNTISFGSTTLTKVGSYDSFIAKYDSNGNVLWVKDIGGTGDDEGYSVSANTGGNVFVTGFFDSPALTLGSTTLTNAGSYDAFIAKYDANGNVLWAKSVGGTQQEFGYAVSSDAGGNVFVTGGFYSSTITFNTTILTRPAIAPDPMFIVKYDANGNVLCASALASGGDDQNGVSADPFGNAYIGGDFEVNPFIVGSTTLIPTGQENIFVAKWLCSCSNPIVNITGNTTICAGQTATLTASGGNIYSWSNGNTANQISVSPIVTSTYSVVVSIGNCSDTSSATIYVSPTPTASVSGITTICSGQSSILTASGGTNYLWNNSSTTSSITVTPTSTSTYSISVSNGVCSADTYITVTIYALPSVIISGNTNLCSGQNTTLTASVGGNYLWNNGATTNSISVSPTTTTSYSVTVTSSNGCTNTVSTTTTVNPTPIAVISPNCTICVGNEITLDASGGSNYSWNTGEITSSIQVHPITTTNYLVTVSNGSCFDTTSTVITVNPNPTASISGTANIFQGQSLTLTASGDGSYLWNTGDTTITILATPNITTLYCVTVKLNNCIDSTCTNVFVESPCDTAGTFFFPNAFSPNGDGDNEVLKIYYNEMSCIATLHLVIYDRWGEQIYETIDKNFSWDGTYPNKQLNTQVMAYHLTVGFTDGKAINRKGNVSLVR